MSVVCREEKQRCARNRALAAKNVDDEATKQRCGENLNGHLLAFSTPGTRRDILCTALLLLVLHKHRETLRDTMSSEGPYGRQGFQSNPNGYGGGAPPGGGGGAGYGGGGAAPGGGGYMAPQYAGGQGGGYGGASYSAPSPQGGTYGADYGYQVCNCWSATLVMVVEEGGDDVDAFSNRCKNGNRPILFLRFHVCPSS